MIHLRQITKVFNAGTAREFQAVRGITLTIPADQITVLKGPSGSGKTTLLSILGALAKPTSGRIMVLNQEITSLPERFLTEIRRKTFGFIFQHFNLIKGLTALENVMIPAYPSGENKNLLRERALHLLEQFDLASKAEAKIEWLSGGEAQRVAIARALINNPRIIIADEPTAHLDTKLSEEFVRIIAKLNQADKTVVIASHDPLVYDSPMVNWVVDLRDGQVVGEGPAL
jgi:putative ABC transport system ATP-binding protein